MPKFPRTVVEVLAAVVGIAGAIVVYLIAVWAFEKPLGSDCVPVALGRNCHTKCVT
jgi:hypothetical protein